jgi:hypothetical protein
MFILLIKFIDFTKFIDFSKKFISINFKFIRFFHYIFILFNLIIDISFMPKHFIIF